MTKPSGQTVFLAAAVVGSCLLVGSLLIHYHGGPSEAADNTNSQLKLADIPFNGEHAYQYLRQICAIGTRRSGTAGMQAQQKLLIEHFEKLGGKVRLQEFAVRHPLDGSRVPMANLIVEWHPERKERILLCTHYDTRPFPDQDKRNPRGTFIGANDGGSGVALLMELGEKMPALEGRVGVDFAMFDGEELVYQDTDPYFLGSEYFAREYVNPANPPGYKYRCAVLLDMIGDADLQIYQERNSVTWADTKPIVNDIWKTAERLGVREFVAKRKHDIRDDHLRLHATAKIPACDLIDFDYPFWHTTEDTPEHCSALSLAKVGWVLEEWLKKGLGGSGGGRE